MQRRAQGQCNHALMYFLNKQAFFCADGNYYVILDLPHDRYLCIEKRRFEPLASALSGWGGLLSGAGIDGCSWTAETERVANGLIKRGILALTPQASKPAHPADTVRPTLSVFDRFPPDGEPISFASRLRFARSAFLAHVGLSFRRIDKVVRAANARCRDRRTPATDCNIHRAAALMHSFTRMRPFFPRDYLCLFDSLALLNFLQAHGLFVTWVFGVRAEPFAAHCWIQLGDVVLNDTLEEVQQYTPIMVV